MNRWVLQAIEEHERLRLALSAAPSTWSDVSGGPKQTRCPDCRCPTYHRRRDGTYVCGRSGHEWPLRMEGVAPQKHRRPSTGRDREMDRLAELGLAIDGLCEVRGVRPLELWERRVLRAWTLSPGGEPAEGPCLECGLGSASRSGWRYVCGRCWADWPVRRSAGRWPLHVTRECKRRWRYRAEGWSVRRVVDLADRGASRLEARLRALGMGDVLEAA